MKKYFGSIFPVVNIAVSGLLFGAVAYRLNSLRLKNTIKRRFKGKQLKLVNDAQVAEGFSRFISQGYRKINIGGGCYNLDGYVNLDFARFPNVLRQVQANILDLGFIADSSLTHVYSNQVIEHLTEAQLLEQLNEYHRILTGDGILSFRTPNALGVSFGFWFGPVPEEGREDFLKAGYPEDAYFFNPKDDWYHRDLFALLHWWYADIGNIQNQHLNLLTPSKIKAYLQATGFEIIAMTKPETSQLIVVARKVAR